jgi:hypothetical protein
MILFQVTCSNAHEFEAWFQSGDSFQQQKSDGDVECPFCSDTSIEKAPMAPNVVTSRAKSNFKEPVSTPPNPVGEQSGQASEVRAREVAQIFLQAVGTLRNQIEKSTDDVGDQFVDEARRIHYGEAKERGIRGVATEKEASDLDEEGIDIYRLPRGPRKNS